MKRYYKFIWTVISVVIISAIIMLKPVTVSAWGDSDGGRPSYSLQQMGEDELGDRIIFNSIEIIDTDYAWHKNYFGKEIPSTTIKYEKNFVGARKCIRRADGSVEGDPKNVLWDGNQIQVDNGSVYLIRLYAHNDNPNEEDAVAEDTKVAFVGLGQSSTLQEVDVVDEKGYATGEKTMKQQIEVNGKISSSNSNPQKYWDYVNFQSDVPFHLEYVYGSALLENNGFASNNNIYNVPGGGNGPVQLSDDVITDDGTPIGFYGLDGRIPGGYQYAQYVSIKVRVIYDYEFMVENKVRLAGSEEWSETVAAKVGDKIEIQTQYKNTSEYSQADVTIKDTLPSNLRYVPGSTKIKDINHKDGYAINEDSLVTDGFYIGNCEPGENTYIMFTAEVVDDNLVEGSNALVNWAHVKVGGTNRQHCATVEVSKGWIFFALSTALILLIIICLTIAIITFLAMIKQKHRSKLK